jgi:Zn-dependent M28 family amino/carboxypeptidase
MKNGDRFYTRSDHYNFAKKGIPVVFFADDEHEDYHMPTDTWDKLEYPKMERIARLAFLIGLRAANANKAPQSLGRRAGWFAEAK